MKQVHIYNSLSKNIRTYISHFIILLSMSMMEEELKLLKDELKALKECQTRYVSLAVTSVGLILSYLTKNGIDTSNQFNGIGTQNINVSIIWLIPLIILLPFSRIFFVKATTISKIVGYYQILEGFHKRNHPIRKYIGWEKSMEVLRTFKRLDEKKIVKSNGIPLWEEASTWAKTKFFLSTIGLDLGKESELKPMSGYWRLIYITFFSLTIFCLVLSIYSIRQWDLDNELFPILGKNNIPKLIMLGFLICSSSIFKYNLKMLYQLERGFHSYKANLVLWETVLLEEKETITAIIENTKLNKPSKLKWLCKKVIFIIFVLMIIKGVI